ncbi:hypothetical protein ACJZ2D_013213 [Fusarium nematophilum]
MGRIYEKAPGNITAGRPIRTQQRLNKSVTGCYVEKLHTFMHSLSAQETSNQASKEVPLVLDVDAFPNSQHRTEVDARMEIGPLHPATVSTALHWGIERHGRPLIVDKRSLAYRGAAVNRVHGRLDSDLAGMDRGHGLGIGPPGR